MKPIEFPEDRLVESFYARNPDVSLPVHPAALAHCVHVTSLCLTAFHLAAAVSSSVCEATFVCGAGKALSCAVELIPATPSPCVRLAADAAHEGWDVQEESAACCAETI